MNTERGSIRPDKEINFGSFRLHAVIIPTLTGNERVEEVDIHEAAHAVVARKRGRRIRRVSIVKTSRYLGVTELDEGDEVVAGASIANNNLGTGGDEHAIHASGRDIGSVISEAGAIVSNSQKEIFAVAVRLRRNAEIGQEEVDDAMESTTRNENQRARLRIVSPEGKVNEHEAKTDEQGNVVFMKDWIKKASSPERPNEVKRAA